LTLLLNSNQFKIGKIIKTIIKLQRYCQD